MGTNNLCAPYSKILGGRVQKNNVSKYNYIIVCPKASWASLICCTHQHYHCQWLPNSKWSNSRKFTLSQLNGIVRKYTCRIWWPPSSCFNQVSKKYKYSQGPQENHDVGRITYAYNLLVTISWHWIVIACSHCRRGQDKTRQDCLVLSCLCQQCEQAVILFFLLECINYTCSLVVRPLPMSTTWKQVRPTIGIVSRPMTTISHKLPAVKVSTTA